MQIESSEIFKMIEIVKNIPKERGYSSKTTETVNSVMFILKTMIRDYEDKELIEMRASVGNIEECFMEEAERGEQ